MLQPELDEIFANVRKAPVRALALVVHVIDIAGTSDV